MTLDKMIDGITNGFDFNGLRVYPLTVRQFERCIGALGCLTYMQQALPLEFVSLPYLRMLHETSEKMSDTEHRYNIGKLMMLFIESFQVTENQIAFLKDERGCVTWYISKRKKPKREEYADIDIPLINATLKVADKKESMGMLRELKIFPITERDFVKLRELLCEINAQEIPDEELDLDIWRSNQEKAAKENVLTYDFRELFFSAKNTLNKSMQELLDMSIWEFSNSIKAKDREIRFKIFADPNFIWKENNNPVPDWRYSKINTNNYGMLSYSTLKNQFNSVADMPEISKESE